MDKPRTATWLSGEQMLPQVARLRYQFCAELLNDISGISKKFEQVRRITAGLELLPYSLGAACLAMFDLARDQAAIVATKAAVGKSAVTLELNEAQRNLLGYRLDSFLDAARRTQNAAIPYLRRIPGLKLDLSKSLSNVADSLKTGGLAIPEPFRTHILEYWNPHGAALKGYRDLGQHYVIVGAAAKVVVPSQGTPGLIFCIPNNPDAHHISELRYDEPQVHVQQFVLSQFLSLLDFSYGLLEQLLDEKTDAALLPAFEGATPLTRIGTGFGRQAYIPVDIECLEAAVQDGLRQLKAHYVLSPEVWSTSNESRRHFAVFRPRGFFVFVLPASGSPHVAANSRGVL